MPDAIWVGGYESGIRGARHCATCGSTVLAQNVVQHENFHKNYSFRRDEGMSKVNWCDGGDHPFKAGEQGSATFAGTEFDEHGAPTQVTMDYCAEHNPARVQREAAKYSLTQDVYKDVTETEV